MASTPTAFQFPTNRKAYPKSTASSSLASTGRIVSIPYERESISKVKIAETCWWKKTSEFQFPTNGKAYPKYYNLNYHNYPEKFQFPTNGKAYPKST